MNEVDQNNLDAARHDFIAVCEAGYNASSLQDIIFCQASVAGGWGLPISNGKPAIPLETNFGWSPGFVDRLEEAVPNIMTRHPNQYLCSKETALLSFPGAFTYGHWIIDIAARCEILSRYRELSTLQFIVPRPFFEWAMPILDAYGIEKNQLVEVGNEDTVFCDRLIIPALMRVNDFLPHNPHHFSLNRLRRYSLNRVRDREKRIGLFVRHVPQTSSGTRAILGGVEKIEETLISKGYVSVTPSELNIYDQIGIFDSCKVIIGEDSSALHNCVWNTITGKLIVLSSSMRHNILHDCMAKHLGMHCRFIYGDVRDNNFHINMQSIEAEIEH